jgi:hypothetical protein
MEVLGQAWAAHELAGWGRGRVRGADAEVSGVLTEGARGYLRDGSTAEMSFIKDLARSSATRLWFQAITCSSR